MNIIIFGATGGTGQELVKQALEQGHTVTAFVRPVNLTNGERIGIYKHGFDANENIKLKISRADVADFMLKQLTSNTYLHKTPGLSY